MTLEQLRQAVQDFFGDTSRSPQAIKDGLEDIADLAAELAATIDVDEE